MTKKRLLFFPISLTALKTPKKLVIVASNRFTYRKFHNESQANHTF